MDGNVHLERHRICIVLYVHTVLTFSTKYFGEDFLRGRSSHNAASIAFAAAVVVIHAHVVSHLVRHNSGEVRQTVVAVL